MNYINQGTDLSSAIFLSAGSFFLIGALFLSAQKIKKIFTVFKVIQHSFIVSGVVLLFIGLITLNIAGLEYNVRFDLTQYKQHTLNPETISIVKSIKKDVRLIVLYVGIPPGYIQDLLAEYQKLNPKYIKAQVIDPLEQLGSAAEFGNTIRADEKKAVVLCDKERQDIDFTEAPLTEEMLTTAIVQVGRDKRKICFVAGHNEYSIHDTKPEGLSIFNALLNENNCITQETLLEATKEIPKDCDVLVIAGPKSALSPLEDKLVQDYLEGGGKALFLIESTPMAEEGSVLTEQDRQKNPPFNNLLNRWGFKINDDVAVDLENHAGQDVGCPATRNYPKHKEIVDGLDYTFYIRPRSISLLTDASSTIRVAPLVLTSSGKNSWAETNRNLQVKFEQGQDDPGPVIIAAVSWEPKNDQRKSDTKVIVFGDGEFLTNNFISQYSNAEIASNAISWLSELDKDISLKSKDIKIHQLNLTSQQKRIVIVLLFSVPLLIALIGLFIWKKQGR
ncbi:MAG: GldG family protein [Candidatus Omnitrophota bacterium]